jgi:Icc protein
LSNSLRILQITDCHLPAGPELPYRGINSHESLNLLLDSVHKFAESFDPDLVLATGDLSEDGSQSSYDWLKKYLGSLNLPVLALPGNHDEPNILANNYQDSPVDNVVVTEHGDWQIIRLNTTLPGTPAGRIKDANLLELEQILCQDSSRRRLIALHHQPIPVGSPWIDKYRLQEPEGFLELIDRCEGVKAVVWGHVHQDFVQNRQGISMMSGPSAARNGVPGLPSFVADTTGPACRWLELGGDGSVATGIIST